ncbi:MAG TPA: creatininase family protein [Actinomycetota bacterium]|nr:creatininase family protein [Actinomycetota bacterium]
MARTTPLLYERLSWPEVREAAGEDRVCLIPAGTLEDHGPHLPLDTDTRIASEICRRAAERVPDEVVLLPPVIHGYTPHHMDFPGPITIGWDTFVRYCADVGSSLARHGFKRILFLNGHGSNIPLLDVAARLIALEHPDVLAASAFYLQSEEGMKVVEQVRESPRGGMGHACELETSIYLAIDPDAVDMARAVDEDSFPAGPNCWMDWSDGPLRLMPHWSAISETGVHGAPTLATAEKGRALLEAAVEECVAYVRELRAKPLPVRREPRERPGGGG